MTLNFEDIKDEARSEVEGSFTLVPTIVFALIVCGLLYLAINGLLRLFAHREVAERIFFHIDLCVCESARKPAPSYDKLPFK